jgi:hypothetical protein
VAWARAAWPSLLFINTWLYSRLERTIILGEQIPLQQWSSFFAITAAASATLLGLLFVVITIAPGIGRQLASKSKVYLTPAVIYLTSVLIMSALLTIPNQTRLSAVIGIPSCVFSACFTLAR